MAVKKDEKTGKWYFYGSFKMKNGKYKQYKKRGFEKKKDAVKAEILYKENLKDPLKKITLDELLGLYCAFTESRIKESTYNSQLRVLDRWIETIGDITVKNVTQNVVEDAFVLMRKNVGYETAKNYLSRFNKFMRFAVRKGYLESNPCSNLEVIKNPNEKKKEMLFWTVEQFNRFIEYVDNPMYHLLFNNQFYMGMRIGETLALTWEDIDFKKNTITIKKTWSKDLHKITTPKTPSSYRTITMPQFLADEYMSFKRLLDVPESMFVFGIDYPICSTSVRSYMHKCIKIANEKSETKIPIIRIHDLRHSCASYMIGNMVKDDKSNFSLYDVAKRLGDNLNTVLSVYAHWLPQADKGIANFMDKDNALD